MNKLITATIVGLTFACAGIASAAPMKFDAQQFFAERTLSGN